MKKPHFLKLIKFRCDYLLSYVRRFGFSGAIISLVRTRFAHVPTGQIIEVGLPFGNASIKLRAQTSDIDTFEKIFVWQEYSVLLENEPRTIIDCGGNTGLSAIWFAIKYPSALVVVLEPNKRNFEMLLENTKGFENIRALHAGVWEHPCMLQMVNSEVSFDSFQFRECNQVMNEGVVAYDLNTVASDYSMGRIDILKMDIEGAEAHVFSKNYLEWLGRTRTLIVEIHGPVARRVVESALQEFCWRKEVSGENDVFFRLAEIST